MVKAGRAFLQRLIDLSTTASQLHHFIRLNVDARSDIEWWFRFIILWNGKDILPGLTYQSDIISLYSDASGSWGCGAVWGSYWFQLEWAGLLLGSHISTKELTPVVIAAAIWGPHWKGKSIRVLSDNTAAVAAINNQSSRVQEMGHLLRCLVFIAARFSLRVTATHIPGIHNSIADALSRNNLALFHSLLPQAIKAPTPIPGSLIHLLLLEKPDWTSQRWTSLWSDIFPQD